MAWGHLPSLRLVNSTVSPSPPFPRTQLMDIDRRIRRGLLSLVSEQRHALWSSDTTANGESIPLFMLVSHWLTLRLVARRSCAGLRALFDCHPRSLRHCLPLRFAFALCAACLRTERPVCPSVIPPRPIQSLTEGQTGRSLLAIEAHDPLVLTELQHLRHDVSTLTLRWNVLDTELPGAKGFAYPVVTHVDVLGLCMVCVIFC